MLHIPYKGGGPAVIVLLSGEATVGFASSPSCISQIRSGQLRGIAVTTAKRPPFLPELPTVAEAGVAGYESEIWLAMPVPAGTPVEIITRVRTDTLQALQFSDVKVRLDASGLLPMTTTPERLGTLIGSEIEKWGVVVKGLGLRVS